MTTEDMVGNLVAAPLGQDALEAAVLQRMIKVAHTTPFGPTLADQLSTRVDVKRQLSGTGFFLEFQVDTVMPAVGDVQNPFPLDVHAKRSDADFLASFILFHDDAGRVNMLEGCSVKGVFWPENVSDLELVDLAAEYAST